MKNFVTEIAHTCHREHIHQGLGGTYRASKANAICERLLGSMRRECITRMLIFGEQHLYRVIRGYAEYFDRARPHQGIGQKIPEGDTPVPEKEKKGKIIAFPVLNGLHHDYRLAA